MLPLDQETVGTTCSTSTLFFIWRAESQNVLIKSAHRSYLISHNHTSYLEYAWLYTRVVSILQKLRYLKDQVMWSNTMLWGMFIPIFKLLTLKMSNHWIAQFYEAISLNFRLIKCSDAGKLTFFSLKIFWNDFKVKYAWFEVKKCLRIEFGVNGAIEWGFRGV